MIGYAFQGSAPVMTKERQGCVKGSGGLTINN
jgi:hypothetical protein